MAKINLDNVRGVKTFSVRSVGDAEGKGAKDIANGELVGVGALLEKEHNLYEAVEATVDNLYLATTPEIDRTSKSASFDHTNKAGSDIRVHSLEKGDIFTVEADLHGAVKAGDDVTVTSGKFEKAATDGTGTAAVATVIEKGTIGADARPAISLRVL